MREGRSTYRGRGGGVLKCGLIGWKGQSSVREVMGVWGCDICERGRVSICVWGRDVISHGATS